MHKREPSVIDPMVRAGGYALTSLCAHASGYLLQANPRSAGDAFLVLALWATTLPFFLAYASSFHPEDPRGMENPESAKWAQLNARKILPIGVALLTGFLLVCQYAYTKRAPSFMYWSVLFLFAVGFFLYGRYTVRLAKRGPVIIRHQLVWPVIFSIALPLYSGIIFAEIHQEPTVFAPVVFLVAYFLISGRLSTYPFLFVSLSLLAAVIILSILNLDGFIGHFAEMAFYLSIAAYLAVFEAWGVTANLSLKEHYESRGVADLSTAMLLGTRYYLAAFVALSLAALTLPILYVFSDFGRLFFWGAAIHALLAFLTWFWAGGDASRLRSPKWVVLKTVIGFLFLVVLVLDAFFRIVPARRCLANLVTIGTLGWSTGLSVLAMKYRYEQDKESNLSGWIRRLHMSRSGVLVLTILLSLAMGLGTLIVEGLQFSDTLVLFKSDRVFMLYIFAVLLCSALLILKGGMRVLSVVAGLCLSARLFTSTAIIGLAVFLPSLRAGLGVRQGILGALPFFLASAGGFLLNDACDYERDMLNKPFRPLPRGLVGRKITRTTGLVTIALGALFSFLGLGSNSFSWLLQLAAVAGVFFYNFIVARVGWLKGPFTAVLCMLPLVFVVEAYGYPANFWWIVAGGYLFCIGRELLMDVLDIKGDFETGITTLPMIIGVVPSELVSLAFSGMAVVAILVFRNSSHAVLQRGEVDLALVSIVILCLLWWQSGSQKRKRQVIQLSWAPMLLAVAAFL